MVRMARKQAESGFYHITMRGDGGLQIFEDDSDRNFFLAVLQDCFSKAEISTIAWCLMDNHVHLLVLDSRFRQSEAIHRLSSTFARRYNQRCDRRGHVFQGRFGSTPIETEEHLLSAVRYIHLNPERAGIESHDNYRWSSYRDYMGFGGFTEKGFVLEMLGGPSSFAAFSRPDENEAPYRPVASARVADDDALLVASKAIENRGHAGLHPSCVRSLPKVERDSVLLDLRSVGLGVSQIARLTGLGTATIKRATRPSSPEDARSR